MVQILSCKSQGLKASLMKRVTKEIEMEELGFIYPHHRQTCRPTAASPLMKKKVLNHYNDAKGEWVRPPRRSRGSGSLAAKAAANHRCEPI
jgi:hypothetical protein